MGKNSGTAVGQAAQCEAELSVPENLLGEKIQRNTHFPHSGTLNTPRAQTAPNGWKNQWDQQEQPLCASCSGCTFCGGVNVVKKHRCALVKAGCLWNESPAPEQCSFPLVHALKWRHFYGSLQGKYQSMPHSCRLVLFRLSIIYFQLSAMGLVLAVSLWLDTTIKHNF